MIVSLRGTLEARGNDWVIVFVGGVGIQVSVPASTLAALGSVGSEVRLHTHLQVRDEDLLLYGFATPEEREAFLALLTVNGVGARIALQVLSTLSPGRLAAAVEANDLATLSLPSGLGRKKAARVAAELKGKLQRLAAPEPVVVAPLDPEVVQALQSLGYSFGEAKRALASLEDEERALPLEERLRRVLQSLAER
ncbi:MAG: Holliday junction branch migration protein RuvA [Chloroflexi bacterium]|nr:Holliday junction branch migration protein RuvA [Chloroflexota bacterium]